jgi:hypothetical protein
MGKASGDYDESALLQENDLLYWYISMVIMGSNTLQLLLWNKIDISNCYY